MDLNFPIGVFEYEGTVYQVFADGSAEPIAPVGTLIQNGEGNEGIEAGVLAGSGPHPNSGDLEDSK